MGELQTSAAAARGALRALRALRALQALQALDTKPVAALDKRYAVYAPTKRSRSSASLTGLNYSNERPGAARGAIHDTQKLSILAYG
jgi:hypothetical protein